jgi:glycosyl transferase family 2
VSLGLFAWLMQPHHWTERDPNLKNDTLLILDIVMLVSIGLIELFRTMNILSNAHATLVARDPVPVVPEPGTKVAFLTSFVPGKEPLEMVTKTLEAAVRLRHRGLMHVWLLDEGDDPDVKAVCARLGVHHFSRKGIPHWNQAKGAHRARTKHGNYNAWLQAHGSDYDFFASVDTDHVPLPNYLERMLGYFRDPDVGFVIGPQVYGNYDTFVTKAAESQQFLFHALIQRAGPAATAPALARRPDQLPCIRSPLQPDKSGRIHRGTPRRRVTSPAGAPWTGCDNAADGSGRGTEGTGEARGSRGEATTSRHGVIQPLGRARSRP